MATITENDKYVLNAIFNPNYPLDFDKESTSDLTDSQNESKSSFFIDYSLCLFLPCRTIIRN